MKFNLVLLKISLILLVFTGFIHILFITNKTYQIFDKTYNQIGYDIVVKNFGITAIDNTTVHYLLDMPQWFLYVFYLLYFISVSIIIVSIKKSKEESLS